MESLVMEITLVKLHALHKIRGYSQDAFDEYALLPGCSCCTLSLGYGFNWGRHCFQGYFLLLQSFIDCETYFMGHCWCYRHLFQAGYLNVVATCINGTFYIFLKQNNIIKNVSPHRISKIMYFNKNFNTNKIH